MGINDDTHAKTAQHAAFWHTLLDVVEPIAPLLGQLLHTAQPLARLLHQEQRLATLAETLEAEDGIATLRQQLTQQGGVHDE